jgi:hypothetical protein
VQAQLLAADPRDLVARSRMIVAASVRARARVAARARARALLGRARAAWLRC